ncbi:MAG: hypothetical protein A3G81_19195 [Betaproteobacteria bacterium RIFCSPLOWO2_12_FULL_65_14]|nr:MAG: hypothetical protein A3G81_19195 [Betaproteobacteria bacterium RIFCSPLOWO2_12_FULL_65_14]
MNPRQLEVFAAMMHTRSVSETARVLKVSQPAITKSLRLAEQAAGFVLFRRTMGRLFPSPEAESLLPEVQRVLGELTGISNLIVQLRDGTAGRVTVASSASLSHAFLSPAIATFRRERPNIRVEVMILPALQVAEQVSQNQADFGLLHDLADSVHVDSEVLCHAEAVCVLPRKHPLARRKTIAARDLHSASLVSFPVESATGTRVRQALAAAKIRRDIDIVVNQAQQAIELVVSGSGIAVIDPFLLLGVNTPALSAVPFRPTIPYRLRIVRARQRPRSHVAEQLEVELRRTVKQLARDSSLPIRAC